MQVSIKDISADKILARVGDLSFPSAIGSDEPITTALGEHAYQQRVLLDMGDVEMLDSSAVGWLLKCNKAFRDAGGQLVIHTVRPAARNVLKVLRVDQVLNVADSEAEAIRAIDEAAA